MLVPGEASRVATVFPPCPHHVIVSLCHCKADICSHNCLRALGPSHNNRTQHLAGVQPNVLLIEIYHMAEAHVTCDNATAQQVHG